MSRVKDANINIVVKRMKNKEAAGGTPPRVSGTRQKKGDNSLHREPDILFGKYVCRMRELRRVGKIKKPTCF